MSTNDLSRVMKMAHILHNNRKDFRWSDIVRYAWYFHRFRGWLRDGVVQFSYIKRDRSIREAKGTLNDVLIPLEDKPQNEPTSTPNYAVMTYYDLDKKAWRAFRITDFLGYVTMWELKEKRSKRENIKDNYI